VLVTKSSGINPSFSSCNSSCTAAALVRFHCIPLTDKRLKASCGHVKGHNKRKVMLLDAFPDFARELSQCLDMRSWLRLSCTNKSCRRIVCKEMDRRQAVKRQTIANIRRLANASLVTEDAYTRAYTQREQVLRMLCYSTTRMIASIPTRDTPANTLLDTRRLGWLAAIASCILLSRLPLLSSFNASTADANNNNTDYSSSTPATAWMHGKSVQEFGSIPVASSGRSGALAQNDPP